MVTALRDEYKATGMRRLLLATGDAHEVYASVGFAPLAKPEIWMELAFTPQPEPPAAARSSNDSTLTNKPVDGD